MCAREDQLQNARAHIHTNTPMKGEEMQQKQRLSLACDAHVSHTGIREGGGAHPYPADGSPASYVTSPPPRLSAPFFENV